jgi:hypothetical protein
VTLSASFFALAFAFCALCVAVVAGAIAVSSPSAAMSAGITAGVALGTAVMVLWRQARRDFDAVLALLGGFALPAAMVVGIYAASVDQAGWVPIGFTVVSGLLGVGCLVATYRRQRQESERYPNVLKSEFGPSGILETEGIQFTGQLAQATAGKPHYASVVLQNCFDQPRSVTLAFDGAGSAKHLRFHSSVSVNLGPAEVVRVTVPVVSPTYAGEYSLYFSVHVAASSGQRVRLWRAQTATNRTTGAQTAALLAVGVLSVGGGVRFTIGPTVDDLWASPLEEPRVETLWRPDQA